MTTKNLGLGKQVRNYKHLILAAKRQKPSGNTGNKLLAEELLIERSELNDLTRHICPGTPEGYNLILRYTGNKHARQGEE